jgi:hypothetical protein
VAINDSDQARPLGLTFPGSDPLRVVAAYATTAHLDLAPVASPPWIPGTGTLLPTLAPRSVTTFTLAPRPQTP